MINWNQARRPFARCRSLFSPFQTAKATAACDRGPNEASLSGIPRLHDA